MSKFLNLTPHAINLDGFVIPPSGKVARVETRETQVGVMETSGGCVPVFRSTFGRIEGIPEVEPGTAVLVSSIVAGAFEGGAEGCPVCVLYVPDHFVRDEQGRITGAQALRRVERLPF